MRPLALRYDIYVTILTTCPSPTRLVAKRWVVTAKASSTCFNDVNALRCAAESGISARAEETEAETLDIDIAVPLISGTSIFVQTLYFSHCYAAVWT